MNPGASVFPDRRHFLDALTGTALPAAERTRIGRYVAPDLVRNAAAAGFDIVVSHDLRSLSAIRAADPDRMSLYQLSRHDLHPDAGPHDTVIVALLREGVPVACGSMRLRWIEGSLREALESKTLLYADPRQAPADELVVCRAAQADVIRSCHVAVAGALWTSRAATAGGGAASPATRWVVRCLNLIATANYRWSWCVSVSLLGLMRQAGPIYGADGMSPGVFVMVDGNLKEVVLVHASRERFRANLQLPGYADITQDLDEHTEADRRRAAFAFQAAYQGGKV